jgi:hypothetical protein
LNPVELAFVSRRAGNVQLNPVLRVLVSQMWVQSASQRNGWFFLASRLKGPAFDESLTNVGVGSRRAADAGDAFVQEHHHAICHS